MQQCFSLTTYKQLISQVTLKNNFSAEIVQFICQDAGQTEPEEPFDRTNTEL